MLTGVSNASRREKSLWWYKRIFWKAGLFSIRSVGQVFEYFFEICCLSNFLSTIFWTKNPNFSSSPHKLATTKQLDFFCIIWWWWINFDDNVFFDLIFWIFSVCFLVIDDDKKYSTAPQHLIQSPNNFLKNPFKSGVKIAKLFSLWWGSKLPGTQCAWNP